MIWILETTFLLFGNLCKDPQVKTLEGGLCVAKFFLEKPTDKA